MARACLQSHSATTAMHVPVPKVDYVDSPRRAALNHLRHLGSGSVVWDACRLSYSPASLLQEENDDDAVLVTGLTGLIERRVDDIDTEARSPIPFHIEHRIAFDTVHPCYSLRLCLTEGSRGFTQIYEFRHKDNAIDGEATYAEEVKALTTCLVSGGVHEAIQGILGPLKVQT